MSGNEWEWNGIYDYEMTSDLSSDYIINPSSQTRLCDPLIVLVFHFICVTLSFGFPFENARGRRMP